MIWHERPSGSQIGQRARSSWTLARKSMPILFLSAIAPATALQIAHLFLLSHRGYYASGHLEKIYSLYDFSADVLLAIAWAALAAPVAVAMHRFILLNEANNRPISWTKSYTRQFFLWLAGIKLVETVANNIFDFLGRDTLAGSLLGFCTSICVIVFAIHMALIFPAVAIQVPSRSYQLRARESWNQMRGYAWTFVVACIEAYLVPVIVLLALFFALRKAPFPAKLWGIFLGDIITAPMMGAFFVFSVAVAAAIASWLYAWVRSKDGEVIY